jgi:hypothetical protein
LCLRTAVRARGGAKSKTSIPVIEKLYFAVWEPAINLYRIPAISMNGAGELGLCLPGGEDQPPGQP